MTIIELSRNKFLNQMNAAHICHAALLQWTEEPQLSRVLCTFWNQMKSGGRNTFSDQQQMCKNDPSPLPAPAIFFFRLHLIALACFALTTNTINPGIVNRGGAISYRYLVLFSAIWSSREHKQRREYFWCRIPNSKHCGCNEMIRLWTKVPVPSDYNPAKYCEILDTSSFSSQLWISQ